MTPADRKWCSETKRAFDAWIWWFGLAWPAQTCWTQTAVKLFLFFLFLHKQTDLMFVCFLSGLDFDWTLTVTNHLPPSVSQTLLLRHILHDTMFWKSVGDHWHCWVSWCGLYWWGVLWVINRAGLDLFWSKSWFCSIFHFLLIWFLMDLNSWSSQMTKQDDQLWLSYLCSRF